MELVDLRTLPALVLLVVPGFIAVKIYDLLVPSERCNWTSHLMEVLSYGPINFVLWFSVLLPSGSSAPTDSWLFRLWLVLALLVSPASMAILVYFLLCSRFLRRWIRHPTPSAWDHVFVSGFGDWVVCHLKTGTVVAGRLTEHSFASTYPRRQDLYLGEAWEIGKSGRITRPVARTAGVLVSMEDCEFLEFFKIGVDSVHG